MRINVFRWETKYLTLSYGFIGKYLVISDCDLLPICILKKVFPA